MTNFLHFWHIRCSSGAIQFIKVPPTLGTALPQALPPVPHLCWELSQATPGPAATGAGADGARESLVMSHGANRCPRRELLSLFCCAVGLPTSKCD